MLTSLDPDSPATTAKSSSEWELSDMEEQKQHKPPPQSQISPVNQTLSSSSKGKNYNNPHQLLYLQCYRDYLLLKKTKIRYKTKYVCFQVLPVICFAILSANFCILASTNIGENKDNNEEGSKSDPMFTLNKILSLIGAICSILTLIGAVFSTQLKWHVKASKVDDMLNCLQTILSEIGNSSSRRNLDIEEGDIDKGSGASPGLEQCRKEYLGLKHHASAMGISPDDDVIRYFDALDTLLRECIPDEIVYASSNSRQRDQSNDDSNNEAKEIDYTKVFGTVAEIFKNAYVTLDTEMSFWTSKPLLSVLFCCQCRYYPRKKVCIDQVEKILQRQLDDKLKNKIQGLMARRAYRREQEQRGIRPDASPSHPTRLFRDDRSRSSASLFYQHQHDLEDTDDCSWRHIRICKYLITCFRCLCLSTYQNSRRKKSLAKTYQEFITILQHEKEEEDFIVISGTASNSSKSTPSNLFPIPISSPDRPPANAAAAAPSSLDLQQIQQQNPYYHGGDRSMYIYTNRNPDDREEVSTLGEFSLRDTKYMQRQQNYQQQSQNQNRKSTSMLSGEIGATPAW